MKIKNLAVLQGGKTSVKNGIITYLPTFEKEDPKDPNSANKKDANHADIRTDINFTQGTIQFNVKAENTHTGVVIVDDENWMAGHSYDAKSFVIYNFKSKLYETSGNYSQFGKNEIVNFRFELFGSNAKLFINNILFCENIVNNMTSPLTLRITSNGKVTISDIEVDGAKPKLFVVMQFSEEYNAFYKDVIKPISEDVGFECIRADEFHSSTPILSDIIRSIKESSAIIAEITPNNPNVFYEIGYAHAILKPTILVCDRNRDKLPFDLSSFRTLFYENSISGKTKVESSLRKYLENIL